MLYFAEPFGYEPIDVGPGASSIAAIIGTDETCCDACYYRKRYQSLENADEQAHLPLLPHMVRLQTWKRQKKQKPYPASLIDTVRMLEALRTVRSDVYNQHIDPVTISEDDFLMEESMISMIEVLASVGPCEDALIRWLARITWAWKQRYGDRFFEALKNIVETPRDELMPLLSESAAAMVTTINEEDASDDEGDANEVPDYEV